MSAGTVEPAFEQGDTLEQVLTFHEEVDGDEGESDERADTERAETERADTERADTERADTAEVPGSQVQELFSQAKLRDTLAVVVRMAPRVLPSDGVGVLLADEHGAMTPAAGSDRLAARADALQVSTHQGPGFQGVCRQQPVIASDLRTDSRWRFWAPQAAELGFRSLLTLALADGDTTGALTFYSRRASAFSAGDLAAGQMFAAQASVAIAVSREREQLLQALASRTDVGRAEGILMERYGVSAPQARTVLQRYATHADISLTEVAEGVVRDRSLPRIDLSV